MSVAAGAPDVVAVPPAAALRVNEIFLSIQGESSRVGLPTVFVRLTGCPLRCRWCDTEYAFHEGQTRPLADIMAEVRSHAARHVCVTGGEPLAQPAVHQLMAGLADAGLAVSLETSGALDTGGVDPRVRVVMDLKCPDSGEADRNRWANLAHLRPGDEVKFVLASRADYEWMREVLAREGLTARCAVLASPVWGELDPAELASWVLADGLDVRLQVQLHKILWQDARGR